MDNIMSYLYKGLFSNRMQLQPTPAIVRGTMPYEVIRAIGSCYDALCDNLNYKFGQPYRQTFSREDIEKELWIHFENQRLGEFPDQGCYKAVFNLVLGNTSLPWYRFLDLVEFVCKYLALQIEQHPYVEPMLKKFEGNLNFEFERLNYGYRIVNHCATEITSEEEIQCIESAISKSKDNIREHLTKAVHLYAKKPTPDVSNSIKESISAVEAICREMTGKNTLGEALKELEKSGIAIQPQLRDGFVKLYAYTNQPDMGIRHALMDSSGTYTPTKDEAYFMLITCSAFVNYLRRKIATP